jgi:uncharacterized membrane protein (DUF373 family)
MDTTPGFKDGSRGSAHLIHLVEHVVYVAISVLLVLTLLLTLAGAVKLLLDGFQDWTGTTAIFQLIDRLLFILMLVEILNTVQASIRTRTLVCEPFLIVGLIACIRRILIITLESSQITQPNHWQPEHMPIFWGSMLELGVLGALVLIMIGSIYVIRLTMRLPREDVKEVQS